MYMPDFLTPSADLNLILSVSQNHNHLLLLSELSQSTAVSYSPYKVSNKCTLTLFSSSFSAKPFANDYLSN